MKKVLLGGALAAVMFAGSAFANDSMNKDCNKDQSADQQSMSSDQGIGGSGSDDSSTSSVGTSDQTLKSSDQSLSNDSYGGSSDQGITATDQAAQQPTTNETNVIVQPPAQQQPAAWSSSDDAMKSKEDHKVTKDSDMRGVSVTLGGGVEGYTGGLAPQINPGPSWGVGVGLRPSKTLGLELGYSGAVNAIDNARNTGTGDIVRNGGSAVATVGLSSAAVQPYLLGGIGVDRYNVRNNENGRFRDDTTGSIPLGVGLRTQVSKFTADLRGTYGMLFNQGFAPGQGNTDLGDIGDKTPTGRFGAQLRLGSTF